jgi:phosphoribosylformimino-5-aminoimidazole carboxamide ribotide isomerase
MVLYPAIDILEGKAVRLEQGSYERATVYDADPLEAARRWVSAGARALHVVDLDGARGGSPANSEHVRRITSEIDVPVQVGGGLRSIEDVREAVRCGASRVVLGTAAYKDVDLLDSAVAELGDRVLVSIDARDGRLALSGWTEQTEVPIRDVIERLGARGVRRFVYSNIDRDGTLGGPDLERTKQVAQAVRGTFVYSGGVSTLEHLRALAGLRQVNLAGVIVGTALYEDRFTLAEGQEILDAGVR